MAAHNQSRKAVPNKLPEMLARAVAHHKAGQLNEAEPLYLAVLKLDPKNGDVLRLLGGLYMQSKRPEHAHQYLEKALKIQPKNAEILNNLGIALRDLGKADEAILRYEEALRLVPDYPEALNNLGNTLHVQGKFQEALVYYDRALRLKPDYTRALHNSGNALRQLNRFSEAVSRYKEAIALKPDDPSLHVDLGMAYHKQHALDEAVTSCQRALQLKPDYFPALSNLGTALRELGRIQDAVLVYEQALRVKPDSAELMVNLGATFWDNNQLDKAIACYQRALDIKPDFVEALINYGTALWGQGKTSEAKEKYEAAERLDPGNPDVITVLGALLQESGKLEEALEHFNRAIAVKPDCSNALWRKSLNLLTRGDYLEGWTLYETGLYNRGPRGRAPVYEKPWDGAPLFGKRLLVWSEQALGDALQFVRYTDLCKKRGGEILVLCAKPLIRLFKNSPSIDDAVTGIQNTDFDYQISMMSLPHFFGTTLETIPADVPYLHVEQHVQQKWDTKFKSDDGFKVGLVWAGNAREGMANANLIDRRRSIHLRYLLALLDFEKVHFYNLQMGPTVNQIDELHLQSRMTNYMDDVTDFMDTAAIINNLDLVITVDTSVAHLAGGLGKPVWILSRYDACWRWLQNRETSPWYPTARIFGQPSMGDWNSVITAVRNAFATEIIAHERPGPDSR